MKLIPWNRDFLFATILLTLPLFFGNQAKPLYANSFTVNSNLDAPDLNPGDGICETNLGNCTLRAAIEETNWLKGADTIYISAGTFSIQERIVIRDDLTIYGATEGVTTLDGGNENQILGVEAAEWLICDSATDSVASVNQFGQYNSTFIQNGSGGLDIPVSISEGGQGENGAFVRDIFVTGLGSGVHRYAEDSGRFLATVAESGADPLMIAFDAQAGGVAHPTKDVFVAEFQPDGAILHYDAQTGDYKGEFIEPGSGELSYPHSIALHNDDLFVTSAGSGAVLRYNGETGEFVEPFVAPNSGGLEQPYDLLFHEEYLFVASHSQSTIYRYSAQTGQFIDRFVQTGVGGLHKPLSMAMGLDGNLYVVNNDNRILRFDGETGAFIGVFIDGKTDPHIQGPSCLFQRAIDGEGPTVNLHNLTLTNGHSVFFAAPLLIRANSHVALTDVKIVENSGRVIGAGITNFGNLTLTRSEVSNNTLPLFRGGGVTSTGAGIYNEGSLTVIDSLISENKAVRGAGIANFAGRVEIINSTISGNIAEGGGGGIRNWGEALLYITNSTITNNQYANWHDERANVHGGGISNFFGGRVYMANSILAGNMSNGLNPYDQFSPDCFSDEPYHFTSQRNNVIGILTENCDFRDGSWGDTRFDLVGTGNDPLVAGLDRLLWNGGPTRTHALLPTSVAIDGVSFGSTAQCPMVDQRGDPRFVDGNDDGNFECDIGAFEFQP